MDSDSSLVEIQERLHLKFLPILENARHMLREYIKKKGKVHESDEASRSADTQSKIDALQDIMLEVDAYLEGIFGEFIKEVAVQHSKMLCDQ